MHPASARGGRVINRQPYERHRIRHGQAPILLAAHVRVIRAAADLLEQARIAGLSVWPSQARSRSRSPRPPATCAPRAAAVARLAALTGCEPRRPRPAGRRLDSTPAGSRRHPVRLHPVEADAAIMTTATITDRSALAAALRELKLSGMLDTLDARLVQARAGDLGHLDFLQVLCQDEISRRETTSLQRRIRAARFETPATLEGFDFAASRNCPPPRSATSPRCAGCSQANRCHPVQAGRVRQEPRRAGPRAPGHPLAEPTPSS